MCSGESGQKKLSAETVPFDLLKEATQFIVKVFGNRFTVEDFLMVYMLGF
ncbi:phage tail assembly chaperone G [Bacillus paranthracis]